MMPWTAQIIVSDDGISEYLTGKDMKGSDFSLIWGTISASDLRDWGKARIYPHSD